MTRLGANNAAARTANGEGSSLLTALDESENNRISGTMRKAGLGKAAIRCWNEIDPMIRLKPRLDRLLAG